MAEFLESTILVLVISTPSVSVSTRKSVIPEASSSEPSVLAATIIKFEQCPSMTKVFSPEILYSLPALVAFVEIENGECLLPSSKARAVVRLPSTMRGK